MAVSVPSQGISMQQQAAQGFLILPWTPLSPITIRTGFSTNLAAQPSRDPFLYNATPFELEALAAERFHFIGAEGSRGTFSSATTTGTSTSSEHTSVSLGVSVGNEYLNAGVSGSYDKRVLENKATSKSSRHCSFRCGSIRSSNRIPLSASAISLLKTGGLPAFTNAYGDYYVDALIIGAESAVLLHTSSLDLQMTENVKIVAEVEFLCFSDVETLAEKSFVEEHNDVRFGLTAFDTLVGQFIDFGNESSPDGGLTIDEARSLANVYADKTINLPERVMGPVEKLKNVLKAEKVEQTFDRDALQTAVASGLVLQIILMPFARLREVMEAQSLGNLK